MTNNNRRADCLLSAPIPKGLDANRIQPFLFSRLMGLKVSYPDIT
jgi:hypothetical protein